MFCRQVKGSTPAAWQIHSGPASGHQRRLQSQSPPSSLTRGNSAAAADLLIHTFKCRLGQHVWCGLRSAVSRVTRAEPHGTSCAGRVAAPRLATEWRRLRSKFPMLERDPHSIKMLAWPCTGPDGSQVWKQKCQLGGPSLPDSSHVSARYFR